MHPELIQIGSLPVHTFGVLMGAGFLAGILYAVRECRKWGIDPDAIFNLSFWIMLSGVLGARLFYILVDLVQKGSASEFVRNPRGILAIWEGGLVWYGGMILAMAVVFVLAKRYRLPLWRTVDVLTPATFLGLAIGRIGCVMAGDDFGKPTDVPWAITFTNPEALVYPESLIGQPLHPTQFYMAIKSFFIAFVCHLILTRWKRFNGQVAAVGLLLYPILRSIVEIFRGDTQRGFVPGTNGMLSTSQGISIVVFAVGVLGLWWLSRRSPERTAGVRTA